MSIHLIATVSSYHNRLAIGADNDMLYNIKEDNAFLQRKTTDKVVVMGRKTWFNCSRLSFDNYMTLVLTNDSTLHKKAMYPRFYRYRKNINYKKSLYFITLDQLIDFYQRNNIDMYVVGGEQVFNLFLEHPVLKPKTIYLTHIQNTKQNNARLVPNKFMNDLTDVYHLEAASDKYTASHKLHYRFLTYTRNNKAKSEEHKYLNLCRTIFRQGNERDDRTGVGTISAFGQQIHIDISQTVPLLTTKTVPWKSCIEELLWFLRGDTDANILNKKGVTIWNGNTSRQFLDSRNLFNYDEGILGPGYGWQMRFFGARYSQAFADTSKINRGDINGFDQLEYIVHELKTNPFSRRIMMCYWNPPDFEKTALLPCHYSVQFYVEKNQGICHLSCHVVSRSMDIFLGSPFNIFSYTVLTYLLALKCDMQPKELIYSIGDAHIYKTHIEQIRELFTRSPRPLPKLVIDKSVKDKDWEHISIHDFDVAGYFPHPNLRAPMAI